ncbi:hypothetical protein [Rhizobium rhizogenes]|uniref:hypothetical protein n=1 Tax=Rhizobium rhizogenes TaxID=359 RepID=UPI0005A2333A|nr:hypothetical protein [Rhizobium rhizogenes]NTG09284.1 hypothetical protein [Rhizobium rhizogenes]
MTDEHVILSNSLACRPYHRDSLGGYSIATTNDGRFRHGQSGFTLRSNTGTMLRSKWVDFNIADDDFGKIADVMYRSNPEAASRAFASALLAHLEEK